jgi:hypothetical protein
MCVCVCVCETEREPYNIERNSSNHQEQETTNVVPEVAVEGKHVKIPSWEADRHSDSQ